MASSDSSLLRTSSTTVFVSARRILSKASALMFMYLLSATAAASGLVGLSSAKTPQTNSKAVKKSEQEGFHNSMG